MFCIYRFAEKVYHIIWNFASFLKEKQKYFQICYTLPKQKEICCIFALCVIKFPVRNGLQQSIKARTFFFKIVGEAIRLPRLSKKVSFCTAPKPPLCKGRCQPNRLTEGLYEKCCLIACSFGKFETFYPTIPKSNQPLGLI